MEMLSLCFVSCIGLGLDWNSCPSAASFHPCGGFKLEEMGDPNTRVLLCVPWFRVRAALLTPVSRRPLDLHLLPLIPISEGWDQARVWLYASISQNLPALTQGHRRKGARFL